MKDLTKDLTQGERNQIQRKVERIQSIYDRLNSAELDLMEYYDYLRNKGKEPEMYGEKISCIWEFISDCKA